jgi:hypothetical protein
LAVDGSGRRWDLQQDGGYSEVIGGEIVDGDSNEESAGDIFRILCATLDVTTRAEQAAGYY